MQWIVYASDRLSAGGSSLIGWGLRILLPSIITLVDHRARLGESRHSVFRHRHCLLLPSPAAQIGIHSPDQAVELICRFRQIRLNARHPFFVRRYLLVVRRQDVGLVLLNHDDAIQKIIQSLNFLFVVHVVLSLPAERSKSYISI